MVSTPSAVPTASVLLDSSASSTASSNGTASAVQGSESSSISGGVVGEERLVDLPPAAAEANWVEVQKRKKSSRGDSRVGCGKGESFRSVFVEVLDVFSLQELPQKISVKCGWKLKSWISSLMTMAGKLTTFQILWLRNRSKTTKALC